MRKNIYLLFFFIGLFIFNTNVKAYTSYNFGDIIKYNGEEYYVIENSNSKQNYVTLLKKEPLTSEEVNNNKGDIYLPLNTGQVPFYYSNKCNSYSNTSGCKTNYEESNIKIIVDNWAESEFNDGDLINVDNYKARLLSKDDLFNNFGYIGSIRNTSLSYEITEDTPSWVSLTNGSNSQFWLMDYCNSTKIYYILEDKNINYSYVFDSKSVRPVINLNKNAIPLNGVVRYSEYQIGDLIQYDNEEYYIIEDSREDSNYVTAIKKDPLLLSDINRYKGKSDIDIKVLSNNVGSISFYVNENCNKEEYSDCSSSYNNSIIKKILKNWSNEKFDDNDLVKVNGYKIRLLTTKELFNNLGYDKTNQITSYQYSKTEDVYDWLYDSNYSYWTMTSKGDSDFEVYTVTNDGNLIGESSYIWNYGAIKPVVNLHKDAIKKGTNHYKTYKVGDSVVYNNSEYYVIKDSASSDNYVTLLKKTVLNAKQVNKYTGGEYNTKNGAVPYYLCSVDNSGTNGPVSGDDCLNDYESSFVKDIIDKWSNDEIDYNDLVYVNGYKSRLLTLDDLKENLFYNKSDKDQTKNSYIPTIDTPNQFKRNSYISYWLGTPDESNFGKNYMMNINADSLDVISSAFIRPVINLNKCALNDSACKEKINNIDVNSNNKICTKENVEYVRYNKYEVGDIVNYKGTDYLVIDDSTYAKKYVTLLKMNSLTKEEIDNYYNSNTLSDNEIGKVSFSFIDGCYNQSLVEEIVNNWADSELELNDLVEINGNKASILFVSNDANLKGGLYSDLGYLLQDSEYKPSVNTPIWLYNNTYSYWISNSFSCSTNNEDAKKSHKIITKTGNFGINFFELRAAIRPMIYLKKEVLGTQEIYNIGDEVEYKGIKFYVVRNSSSSDSYLILLKDTPLSNGQINTYSGISMDNNISFYTSSDCAVTNESGCKSDYESSLVKQVVDEWAKDNFNDGDLIEVDKYKARLISYSDLIDNLSYVTSNYGSNGILSYSEDTPPEVYSNNEKFWSMGKLEDNNIEAQEVSRYVLQNDVYEKSAVRPVININKCLLDGGCIYDEIEIEVCKDKDIKPNTINGNDNFGEKENNPDTGDNVIYYIIGCCSFSILLLYIVKSKKYITK